MTRKNKLLGIVFGIAFCIALPLVAFAVIKPSCDYAERQRIYASSAQVYEEYPDSASLESCLGDSTMRELTLYWDAYGWPEEIAYAERRGNYTNSIDSEPEYRVLGEYVAWRVGISCSPEEAVAFLEPLVSDVCHLNFRQSEHTQTELRVLLQEVVNEYKYDLAIDDIWIEEGRIRMKISPFVMKYYEPIITRKYGTAVALEMTNPTRNHLGTFDENGNMDVFPIDSLRLEIFCILAILAMQIFAIVWVCLRGRISTRLPKFWMRLISIGAFLSLVIAAYPVTGRLSKPPVEKYYETWLEPYSHESEIVQLLPYFCRTERISLEPTEEQISEKMTELLLCETHLQPAEKALAEVGDIVSFDLVKEHGGSVVDIERGRYAIVKPENSFACHLAGAEVGKITEFFYTEENSVYRARLIVSGIFNADIELTEDFVKENSKYESLAALKAAAVSALEVELGAAEKEKMTHATLCNILQKSTCYTVSYEAWKPVADLEDMFRVEAGISEEDYDREFFSYAEREGEQLARVNATVRAMTEKYKIKVSDKEILEYAADLGYTEAELEANEALCEAIAAKLEYGKLSKRLLRRYRPK